MNVQLHEVAKGCDLVVGTPGRLIDFINSGVISLHRTQHLALDEADRSKYVAFT